MKKLLKSLGRVNVQFLSLFVGLFILYVGFSIYEHLRYSHFTLIVKGRHTVSDAQRQTVKTTFQSGDSFFYHLHTSWWFWKVPYTLDKQSNHSMWFRADPSPFDKLRLSPPISGGRTETAEIVGDGIGGNPALIPGHWYRINEGGEKWYQIEFQWDGW